MAFAFEDDHKDHKDPDDQCIAMSRNIKNCFAQSQSHFLSPCDQQGSANAFIMAFIIYHLKFIICDHFPEQRGSAHAFIVYHSKFITSDHFSEQRGSANADPNLMHRASPLPVETFLQEPCVEVWIKIGG